MKFVQLVHTCACTSETSPTACPTELETSRTCMSKRPSGTCTENKLDDRRQGLDIFTGFYVLWLFSFFFAARAYMCMHDSDESCSVPNRIVKVTNMYVQTSVWHVYRRKLRQPTTWLGQTCCVFLFCCCF